MEKKINSVIVFLIVIICPTKLWSQKLMIDSTSFVGLDTTLLFEDTIFCFTEYDLEEQYSISKCFFKNGLLAKLESERKGEVFGTSLFFYSNGNIREIRQYERSQPVGVWYGYYKNGNVMFRDYYGTYIDPMEYEKDSISTNKNGFTYYETKWVKPKYYNGNVKSWYPNGKLKSLEHYDKGIRNGIFKYYDEAGKLIKRIKYKDNLIVN